MTSNLKINLSITSPNEMLSDKNETLIIGIQENGNSQSSKNIFNKASKGLMNTLSKRKEFSGKVNTSCYIPALADQKDKKFFSPVVMKIVNKHQIALSELEKISGTGRGGRVTKKDILLYIDEKEKSEPINLKNDSHGKVQKKMMITSNDEEMSIRIFRNERSSISYAT